MPPIAQRPILLGFCWSVGVRQEGVLVPSPDRDVVVTAVRRDAHERLRHEARERVELAADLLADLPEGREVVGRLLGPIEAEVQLDLPRRVLVIALDHVEAHALPVLDHLVDDRLELRELVDVVAVGLCLALDRGLALLVELEPHHLRLGAGAEMETRLLLEVGLDPLEVRPAVRGEVGPRLLALLAVAEAGHPDSRDPRVPRKRHEGLRLGNADELRRLRPVTDVVPVPVGKEVRGRAVDQLEALVGDRLPVRSRDALAHDPTRDGRELVVDVRDPEVVDLLADLGDLLVTAVGADEGFEIGRHAPLLFFLNVRREAADWQKRQYYCPLGRGSRRVDEMTAVPPGRAARITPRRRVTPPTPPVGKARVRRRPPTDRDTRAPGGAGREPPSASSVTRILAPVGDESVASA